MLKIIEAKEINGVLRFTKMKSDVISAITFKVIYLRL